nr:hypothetical protein [uncultured Sphaerochaeta sp.]
MPNKSAFSAVELVLLDACQSVLDTMDISLASLLKSKIDDLHTLAGIVERSSSLDYNLGISIQGRNRQTLASKLTNQGIEEVINLPVKASLGRSFIIAKLHLYGFLLKITENKPYLAVYREAVRSQYHTTLFSLMAEDLYISIISDSSGDETWVGKASHELITMWEDRSRAEIEVFAPLLQQLWEARNSLVPVLGTLLGTVELLQLSMQLNESWHVFLEERGDQDEVVYALNEFLFSLSYEQQRKLEIWMDSSRERVVSRSEAAGLLNLRPDQRLEGPSEDDLPVVRLYRSFLRRNALARMRRETDRKGPHRTLEQYLLLYLWERDI